MSQKSVVSVDSFAKDKTELKRQTSVSSGSAVMPVSGKCAFAYYFQQAC